MICCTNKCIINERYIPEHQNKLNIYDLQNYEFLPNFFQPKKIVNSLNFKNEKIRKIRILDLWGNLPRQITYGLHINRNRLVFREILSA